MRTTDGQQSTDGQHGQQTVNTAPEGLPVDELGLSPMKDTGFSMAKIGDNTPKTLYITQFYIIKFT